MDDHRSETGLNREAFLPGKAQPGLLIPSLTATEMREAYGLLYTEVLQLRKQRQQLRYQLVVEKLNQVTAHAQAAVQEQAAELERHPLSHQATLVIQLTRLAEEAKQAAILNERNRIARDIHDTIAQFFTSILMRLQTAELSLPAESEIIQHNLQLACELARQGLTEARRLVYALRPQPLEQENFSEALKHCLQLLVTPFQIAGEFCVIGRPQFLPDHLEDELLRIAQEAIGNACKHAAARKIEVQLIFAPHKVCLVVRDNGQGFVFSDATTHKGFGVISMEERAQQIGGKFCLSSQPGQGTEIVVEVELP
jgi:signal transduction histidine kinase